MAVLSSKSFTTDNPRKRATKGPLIRVTLPAGNIVKMYQADALAAGYIKPKPQPQNKALPPAQNKMLPAPVTNKAEEADEGQVVDFSTIKGVGLASARLIVANGIATYDELQAADVSFLSSKARQAVEDWRNA